MLVIAISFLFNGKNRYIVLYTCNGRFGPVSKLRDRGLEEDQPFRRPDSEGLVWRMHVAYRGEVNYVGSFWPRLEFASWLRNVKDCICLLCHNWILLIGGLNSIIYFLIVFEARNIRSKYWYGWLLLRLLFLVGRWLVSYLQPHKDLPSVCEYNGILLLRTDSLD